MSFLPSQPDANLVTVFRRFPELARPLHGFAEALMRGPSPFSPGERELIAAFVSTLNGCDYCRGAHLETARHLGVEPEVVDACVADLEASPVREAIKPVLRYCRKLNDAPGSVERADADAVYAAGWDEEALCHAAGVVGFFNLMNRWVEGLGLPAQPQLMQVAGRMLSEKGYTALSDLLPRERGG